MIPLTGTLTCPPDRQQALRDALPGHLRLTRCRDIKNDETKPGIFSGPEPFTKQMAFDAHQALTHDSAWLRIAVGMPRDDCIGAV